MFNDALLNIDWGIDLLDAIISEKDLLNKSFAEAEMNFEYKK